MTSCFSRKTRWVSQDRMLSPKTRKSICGRQIFILWWVSTIKWVCGETLHIVPLCLWHVRISVGPQRPETSPTVPWTDSGTPTPLLQPKPRSEQHPCAGVDTRTAFVVSARVIKLPWESLKSIAWRRLVFAEIMALISWWREHWASYPAASRWLLDGPVTHSLVSSGTVVLLKEKKINSTDAATHRLKGWLKTSVTRMCPSKSRTGVRAPGCTAVVWQTAFKPWCQEESGHQY